MFDKPPRYRSYLLTVWEERTHDAHSPLTWRFSLEDARTGQRRGFADLDALVAALRQEMAEDRTNGQVPAAWQPDQTGRPSGRKRGEMGPRRRGERR